jgi:hypothetical protein
MCHIDLSLSLEEYGDTVGIRFWAVEDSDVSEMFWLVFSTQFGTKLSSFVLASAQGAGLRKFARRHGFTHRLCLRHFRASLNDLVFSVFVHQAVKHARSWNYKRYSTLS